ncbi:MAG: pyridoxal phosphate-dependent aminotransferase [Oscillospiraceae bacterium]|nr:pyridoxal phosphate-dependent aminotransferase [Oscillospiraceae bacterium]
MYDFSTWHRRVGIGAEKWDAIERAGITDPDVIPFSVADMEWETAPEIQQELAEKALYGCYGYTVANEDYQRAVQRWMRVRHNWDIDLDWMVQSYGVVPAIGAAIQAFTRPGDGILIQPPVYPPFRNVPASLGREVVANPLRLTGGRYEMDFDGLEAKAARPNVKMLVLCSPHNPVGRVWTRPELERVAEICLRHGVLVFSDEIHFDFVHAGHSHTVYASLSEACRDNCIIGTAASKTFSLAGLSTSNIIIPNPKLRKAYASMQLTTSGFFNNYFGLAATKTAYELGESWLEAMLAEVAGNFEYVRSCLREKFPSVWVSDLEGTYLMWADFRSFGLAPRELDEFFSKEALLFLNAGDMFGPGGEGFQRINLACPRRCLETAMDRLDQAAARRGLPR